MQTQTIITITLIDLAASLVIGGIVYRYINNRKVRLVRNILSRIIHAVTLPVFICTLFYLVFHFEYWIGYKANDDWSDKYLNFGWDLFMTILYPLIWVLCPYVIGLNSPARIRGEFTALSYEKFGRLSWWGRVNRRYKDRKKWLPTVIEALIPYAQAYNHGDTYNVLSPSANSGEDEYKIAQDFSRNLDKWISMSASDKAYMGHKEPQEGDPFSYTYTPGVDGADLKKHVQQPIHMIWDMKGYLWYASSTFLRSKQNSLAALRLYYDLLDDHGILVVDASKEWKITRIFNLVLMIYVPLIFGFAEKSTYEKILRAFNDKRAEVLFDIELVGSGMHRIAILKKKPAAHEQQLAS